MTRYRIKDILDILNTLDEYLLSLPDDMLLNIDPRDNDSIEQGTQFIKEFNDNYSQFSEAVNRIERQIKQYFSIDPGDEDEEVEHESTNKKFGRVIQELDRNESHTLDENFTYKRPYGFILDDTAYKGIRTWKWFYIRILNMTFVRNGINSTIEIFRPCRKRFEHPKQPLVGDSNQFLSRNCLSCERLGTPGFQLCGYLDDSGQRSR